MEDLKLEWEELVLEMVVIELGLTVISHIARVHAFATNPSLCKAWARKHTQTGVDLSHEARNLLAGHTKDVKKTQVISLRFCDYDQHHCMCSACF